MKHQLTRPLFSLLLCVVLLPVTGFAEVSIPQDLNNNPNIAQIEVYQSTNANYDPRPTEPQPVDYRGDNGKWGLKTQAGVALTEPVWDAIRKLQTLPLYTVKQDSKWGIISADGTVKLEPQYKEIKEIVSPRYEDTLIRVLTFEDQYGLLDSGLNLILPAKYDFVDQEIYEQTVEVGRDYGYTLVDFNGQELLPLQKNWVHKTKDPNYFLCGTKDSGEFYLVNRTGEPVTQNVYQSMELAGENALIISESGLYDLIDFTGNILVSCQYENLIQLPSGVLFAIDGDLCAYYDLTGRMIGGRTWENPGAYWHKAIADASPAPDQMLYLIKDQGKYGYMDYQGDVIVSPQYEEANGYFVQLNGKTGLISTDGSYLVEPRWNLSPNTFHADHGYYLFYLTAPDRNSGSIEGMMNSKGEILLEASDYQIYFGVNDWLFLYDKQVKTVYHITLKDTAAPLSDTLLANPPVITAAVDALVSKGVLLGDETGDMQLTQTVSRAEFLTMLARLDGWDETSGGSPFADVQGHWAAGTISAAVSRGLVTGYTDSEFGPEDAVTARQAISILLRAKHCPEEIVQDQGFRFQDAWSYANLTFGHGFLMNETITRQDAAVLLNSYQNSDVDLSTKEFSDYIIEYTDQDNKAPKFYL